MALRRIPAVPAPVALLVLLALLVRALVPAGWMPVASPAGPVLVICTGSGAIPMPAGSDHHLPPSHEMPCAFAAVAAAPSPVVLALPVPVAVAVVMLPTVPTARIGEGLGAPPQPSTGPPVAA